jgi:polyisoprenoid-binding protein YceI
MIKLTVPVMAIAIIMSSCANNGEKAETQDAKEVSVTKNEETVTYNKVNTQSNVDWRASHLGGAQPRFGKISLKSAQFLTNNNKLTNGTVLMDLNSLTVESFPEGDESADKLKGHLQSADFF